MFMPKGAAFCYICREKLRLGILDRQLAFQSENVAKKWVLTPQHSGGILRKDRGIAGARAG